MSIETSAANSPEVQALVNSFDATNIRFNDRAATLAAIREQGEIFDKDGVLHMNYNGQVQTLTSVLTHHALTNTSEVDKRTLPRDTQDSKENYTSVRAKCDFIEKFGDQAWAELPTTSKVVPNVIEYQDDFRKLPLSEKARLVKEDPDYVAKLPPRPDPNRTETGTFIAHAAIAHNKKIRPTG